MRTCRKILLVAAAVFAAAHGFCGVGATQTWVANYVSNFVAGASAGRVEVASTNGVATFSCNGWRLEVEESSEKALAIVEDTQLSALYRYTNGLVLARVPDQAAYKAGGRSIRFDDDFFYCTAGGRNYMSEVLEGRTWLTRFEVVTNMTDVAISGGGPSVSTNRVFFCALARTYIQPSRAAAILEGE